MKKPKLISESKRFIPLTWLSFLAKSDLEESESEDGIFVDREEALARSASNLPFLFSVFKEFPTFEVDSMELIGRIEKVKCGTIAIDIAELISVETGFPGIGDVMEAIANRNEKFRFKLPSRKAVNPATGEKVVRKGIEYKSTRDLIYRVCWFELHEPLDTDSQSLKEYFNGHIRS